MSETCYCCNEAAAGQGDHVPPLALFARGTFAFRRPIIVPSCTTHNQGKSAADEYLRYILASSAKAVPAEVIKGVARSVVRHAKNPNASLRPFGMERTDKGLSIGESAPINSDLLDQALGKVARGLYYHHHRGSKKLAGSAKVYPLFLGIEGHASKEERESFEGLSNLVTVDLRSFPIQGEHKEVFAYQVLDSPDLITVTMIFYQTKVALVMAEPRD